MRWAGLVVGMAPALAGWASAQDSEFGIRGLGMPGRWETVRSRTTGGAFGPFEPMSPLVEAGLADVGHLTATAMQSTSYRNATVGGTSATLRSTRYPLLGLAGPVTGWLTLAAGFTTYLDKTYDITVRDSVALRGTNEPYTDEITSDGSVADVRVVAATRVNRRLAIGAGFHVLEGSTRLTAQRRFDDTTFHTAVQSATARYDGLGVSGSVLIGVAPGLTLAGWARDDDRLRAKVADTTTMTTNLPHMLGGGFLLAPSAAVRVAGALAWRSWSRAGPGAFNTLDWSAGGELTSGSYPIRLGARGGQLPFGPGPTAPTEFAVSFGTGRTFSQGRALIDVGVEHLNRKGSGLSERVWTILVGLTVRP